MRKIFLLLYLLLSISSLEAQLKADFTPDKAGGCSPFSVSFTNATTGASASATYEWNLGNGNTSVFKNAGAVYHEEKTYTVTLTVKDGGQTSTQTKTITVYKKPAVAFTFTPNSGCLPLTANFTSSSQAGDGNITTYHWDFGDGSTQQSTGPAISHVYNFSQKASVSLTAVNSYGCSNTLTKNDAITIHPALQASFSADKTTLCDLPGNVVFTNTSSGNGTLSYEWDFGDGSKSTDKNPTHSFTKKGVYTVKLIVKSSEGCTSQEVKSQYINAANFDSDIQVPALICENANAVFTNNTSVPASQTRWIVDGVETYYWYNTLSHTFTKAGQHKLEVINTFNGCEKKVSREIEVKPSPKVNGFIAEVKDPCGAPAKVEFKDTTTGTTSWQWNFNYYYNNSSIHATTKNASYTYQADNLYYITLTAKNAEGCSGTAMQSVSISKPQVGIYLDDNSRHEDCGQLKVKVSARSTGEIQTYSWDFGDGTKSTDANPTHTYTKAGSYIIKLTYKTDNGCTGTVQYHSYVHVREKPKANFSVQSEVCGNTPVQFTNTTTGYVTNYLWDFGDNNGTNYWENHPKHQYQQEGEYTVKLIAINWICNDTIVKQNVIKVKPPFPKIEKAVNTCDGTRGLVNFTDGTKQANTWRWDFGDGTTSEYNTAQSVVGHTYTKTGSYKVVLTTTNAGCTVKDSTIVHVLLKQNPVFSIGTKEVCLDQSFTYQVKGLEGNPHPVSIYNNDYEFVKWEYSDGTAFTGSVYNGYGSWNPNTSGEGYSNAIKDDNLRVIIRSPGFYCQDTSNYVPLKINGVIPAFDVLTDNACFKQPVAFRDKSTTTSDNSIASWEWNFGDGTTEKYTQGGQVTHKYNDPGYYYASLKVTDKNGCSSTTPYYYGYVRTAGPKAAFTTSSGNSIQLNTPVTFYNNTNTYNAYNVSYQWDLGNGVTSSQYSPSYTYTEAGQYEVMLIARDQQTGCTDTAKQTITVKVFNTAFTFTTAFIGNYGTCPPVRANFTNTSTNYIGLLWDFGDGFTLENQHSPSHVYEKAGKYIVTLTVHGYNGLVGVYEDSVFIEGPTATIEADKLEGCKGTEVKLHAPTHTDTESYVWDFGDGFIHTSVDSLATHTYITPGLYTPSLILEDSKGCSSVISLPDKVTIHPDPDLVILPATPVVCKTTGVQLTASGAVQYEWTPAEGLGVTNAASTYAYPAETTTYTLNGTDEHGCSNSITTTVIVPGPVEIDAKPVDDICIGNSANLEVNGADSYQWIDVTDGLNNLGIANPVASPLQTTLYTVVGFDQYKCYSDTTQVEVIVRPAPAVNAGSDKEVIFGTSHVLNISTSNDVVRWNWTPAEFLSCTNCPSPITTPYKPMEYVVEVFNGYNCSAKDSIIIKTGCAEKSIYIPTAFTPNADGLNDRFTIHGTGISNVRSLRIFNRWGELIFERKNFYPNDQHSAWDGTYRQMSVPSDTYVYIAELECNAGEVFLRKGTVTVIR